MSTEPKNDKPTSSGPPIDRTTSPNAPRRPKSLIGLVVLLPVVLLCIVLWLNRAPEPVVETVNPIPPRQPSPAASPQPGETATPAAGGERAILKEFTVFLPTADGKLAKKMVVAPKIPSSKPGVGPTRGVWIDLALGALFSEGSAYFPIGSHPIAPTKTDGDVITVDLNKAYLANSEAWSSAETTTRVMSIVDTAAATDHQITGKPSTVRLLVEGKPVSTFGELDASSPLAPDFAVPAP